MPPNQKIALRRAADFHAAPSRSFYMKDLIKRYAFDLIMQGIKSHFLMRGRGAAPDLTGNSRAWVKLARSTIRKRRADTGGIKFAGESQQMIGTGALKSFIFNPDNIKLDVNFKSGKMSVSFKNRKNAPPYLLAQDRGRISGTIRPKRAKVLAWKEQRGKKAKWRAYSLIPAGRHKIPARPLLRMTRNVLKWLEIRIANVVRWHFEGDVRFVNYKGN